MARHGPRGRRRRSRPISPIARRRRSPPRRPCSGRSSLQRPDWRPRSLLDVGAGPGVATWAALEAWPSLTELTLVEVEPEMLAAGRELLPDARWVAGDVSQARGPADLVIASYVLGELRDPTGRRGAPLAAERGHACADRARDAGGLPPHPRRPRHGDRRRRPHHRAVPARPVRARCGWTTGATSRSGSPARSCTGSAKGVELGYEDEKFSYAVSRARAVPQADARIIRQPQVRSGHVNLVTCERDGIHQRTISRKQGGRFKEARSAAWGDAIADPSAPRP